MDDPFIYLFSENKNMFVDLVPSAKYMDTFYSVHEEVVG